MERDKPELNSTVNIFSKTEQSLIIISGVVNDSLCFGNFEYILNKNASTNRASYYAHILQYIICERTHKTYC